MIENEQYEVELSQAARKIAQRAVAMMRNGFGGHPYGPSQPIAEERIHGQVGGTCRDVD